VVSFIIPKCRHTEGGYGNEKRLFHEVVVFCHRDNFRTSKNSTIWWRTMRTNSMLNVFKKGLIKKNNNIKVYIYINLKNFHFDNFKSYILNT